MQNYKYISFPKEECDTLAEANLILKPDKDYKIIGYFTSSRGIHYSVLDEYNSYVNVLKIEGDQSATFK